MYVEAKASDISVIFGGDSVHVVIISPSKHK